MAPGGEPVAGRRRRFCRNRQGVTGTVGPGARAEHCPYVIDTSALVTKELVFAFALLGVLALVPVALKTWKARNAAV